jgi:hypothetical protein
MNGKGDSFNCDNFKKKFNRHFNKNSFNKSRIVYNSNIVDNYKDHVFCRANKQLQGFNNPKGSQVQVNNDCLSSVSDMSERVNPIIDDVKVRDFYIKKECKHLSLNNNHVCNNNIPLCKLQAGHNEHMKVMQDVLQRDERSNTQATGGKHTRQGRVSSGGSPGCARIVDNECKNDIEPHTDKYKKIMRSNNACCGASQWGNVIKCDNIASRNDAGHK